MKTPKKCFMFQGTELSYISGNGNPKKLFIFQEVTFQAQKIKIKPPIKNFLYFRKQSILAPSLKIMQRLKNKNCLYTFSNQREINGKEKSFLYFSL